MIRDVRNAVRRLIRARSSSAIVILTLAVSVGATTATLASLLFGVSPGDPVVLGGVAVTLLATALAASVLPALSASRVDPMIALRDQP